MNTPKVAKRMQQTIKNVKTELKNVKHLTNNQLPKNDKGIDVDLSVAWIDVMNKQLEKFLKRDSDRLEDMIKDGLTEYEKALKLLLEEQKAIKAENAEKDTKEKKNLQNKRTTARNTAIKAIDDKEKNLATAATAMKKAKSDFQAAEDSIHKITDNAKKDTEKINQKYEAKKTALTKAKGKLTTAKK